ncbi:hypothetical protein SE92_16530 [Bradyrhizobium sp. AT1]|uniref:hypothetical protein n=1 Tax=Bradyrhizobium sp. AT1 TaxID=574934 RepID=UPI000795DA3C|nr:hypothetical protein [Bradyrhizobium sp. AT1]KYG21663.1 hypothetical protein SE92_16530 [Bradyrhizobium sp. AT1]
MERILFGDNQFFGINHLSEEKARQQALRFQQTDAIVDVLQAALQCGVGGFMCTTHDLIGQIADDVRARPSMWQGFRFYPGMPYAHKYANAVTELGYFDAMRKFLPKEGLIDVMVRGSKAVLGKDIEGLITLLVDSEMKMFEGLETPVIFLQNVVTDLVQGLGFVDAFGIFAHHVRERYGAEPGFITMNLPKLLPLLKVAGVENPIVCANVNKIAFRMCGGIEGYREATKRYPSRVIAMSVLASGGIRPREAIEWVTREPYVSSILFGASSRTNIENTVALIRQFDEGRQAMLA